MGSGRRIRHVREVCWERQFSVNKDIRLPVLPFVHFAIIALIIPLSQLFGHLLSSQKLFATTFDFFLCFLFFDNFCLLSLFVPIKVLCHSVTQDRIHCAQPPNICSKVIFYPYDVCSIFGPYILPSWVLIEISPVDAPGRAGDQVVHSI